MLNNISLGNILGLELPSLEIKDVHWQSQESKEGSLLFYKIPDTEKGLELFRSRIQSAKFSWLIVNKEVEGLPSKTSVIAEPKWLQLQNKLLDLLYPLPSLKMIGITGTNGKTTTTDLILQLGHLVGKKGMSIGTLGVRELNKTLVDFGLTSPSYIDLRKFLNRIGQDKDFCVMEASSHALMQDRLHGINFDGAGWLSFSQDHLDYHQTMDAYFAAKSLIYKKLKEHARLFVPQEQVDLFNKLLKVSDHTQVAPFIESELPLFFKTQFNKNNLEVAKAIIESVFKTKVSVDYQKLLPPDGRFYIKAYKSNYIVVDFAHSPDALENVCRGIKQTFPGYRLKVLFGCGGDRDRSKRPQMASVVAKWADVIYVTSDNPRSEDPQQIMNDIIVGIKDKTYKSVVERPKAVAEAFSELTENEVLLLAGKGHEDYILINGVKHPYSDIRQVDEFISRNKA